MENQFITSNPLRDGKTVPNLKCNEEQQRVRISAAQPVKLRRFKVEWCIYGTTDIYASSADEALDKFTYLARQDEENLECIIQDAAEAWLDEEGLTAWEEAPEPDLEGRLPEALANAPSKHEAMAAQAFSEWVAHEPASRCITSRCRELGSHIHYCPQYVDGDSCACGAHAKVTRYQVVGGGGCIQEEVATFDTEAEAEAYLKANRSQLKKNKGFQFIFIEAVNSKGLPIRLFGEVG